MFALVALVALVVLVVNATLGGRPDIDEAQREPAAVGNAALAIDTELTNALRRWDAAGPSSYSFVGTWRTRESAASRVRVVVADGEVVQLTGLWLGSRLPADQTAATAENLLSTDLAGTDITSLVLDADTGFPIELRTVIGNEHGPAITTEDFQVGSGDAPRLAVSGADGLLVDELTVQREVWMQRQLTEYDFDLERLSSGFTAVSGRVIDGALTASSDPGAATRLPVTVDEIFDWLADAMTRYTHIVIVFDPVLGYPRQAWLDRPGTDDEVTISYAIR